MNIAHYEEYSNIYGPGTRFIIWVQGCSIHCQGCWNQDMWSFTPKKQLSVEELLSKILAVKNDIEGITLLGGEPFDQYNDVLELTKKVSDNGLSVMIYTGYEMDELKQQNKTEILQKTDILISGRYMADQRSLDLQWRGSSNQQIHFLTSRYRDYQIEDNNYIEISLDEWGQVNLYGFPSGKIRKKLLGM